MDDSLKAIETELKGLRPRQPSASLLNRLDRELAEEIPADVAPPARPRYQSATNLGSWKWLSWRSAGLAAAFAVVGSISLISLRSPLGTETQPTAKTAVSEPTETPSAMVSYQPVSATNVLYDVRDEGYGDSSDASADRRVRARYVDTYTWKHPKSNASLKWSVPRDEVRVIPASWN